MPDRRQSVSHWPILVTMLTLLAPLAAQEPSRVFDAVSIRESATGRTNTGLRLLPSGDVRVQHLRARHLVSVAHRIDVYRVVNAPAWTDVTYYDVLAKANAATTRDEVFEMMQAMMAERFKLAVHRETRALPGFALVRASRAAGPGLRPAAVNCEDNPRGARCNEGGNTSSSMKGFGVPIANIVQLVSGVMGAPIVDRTSLIGAFDIDLRWSAEGSAADDAPVLATALQEQLGLRLQREQVPTEVLVVDHIERPSEN